MWFVAVPTKHGITNIIDVARKRGGSVNVEYSPDNNSFKYTLTIAEFLGET